MQTTYLSSTQQSAIKSEIMRIVDKAVEVYVELEGILSNQRVRISVASPETDQWLA